VLRIAMFELLHCQDIPPAVVLNEAIDLAKYFSNSDSGKFVNGILDHACSDLKLKE
jgi:N utilization substance protein B